jgi:hypothetical protein
MAGTLDANTKLRVFCPAMTHSGAAPCRHHLVTLPCNEREAGGEQERGDRPCVEQRQAKLYRSLAPIDGQNNKKTSYVLYGLSQRAAANIPSPIAAGSSQNHVPPAASAAAAAHEIDENASAKVAKREAV